MTMTVGHSSPDTQAVGALHRLAVPQQEAALVSKPLQQTLCGSAPDAAKVEGLDQRPFHLHAERRATLRGLRQGVATHTCVCKEWGDRKTSEAGFHTFYTSATQTVHIFSLCRWRLFVLLWTYFPLLCSLALCRTRTNTKCLTMVIFLFSGPKLTVCKMNYREWTTCFNSTNRDLVYFAF